ncbi:MAG: 2-amino-4-hydroxy-6-hydroxymethyldihydropteridine diphosphokinase [Gammaproteobacteria bacterium]|nr:2-amino-4-hydroxy-6-hydroxymethyldihydropteridine diphosphokinase [Gammaproteobacteria bacterium]
MTRASDWILVALGANLGDPCRQLREARAELEGRLGRSGVLASSMWSSRPVDCPPGSPDFVNAVLAFPLTVAGSARELLSVLQEVERAFGRNRDTGRNAPRTLDLDLLIYGDLLQSDPRCLLPHPRALERRFVVEPAAEVLPDLIWPGTGRRLSQVREALRKSSREDPAQADMAPSAGQW